MHPMPASLSRTAAVTAVMLAPAAAASAQLSIIPLPTTTNDVIDAADGQRVINVTDLAVAPDGTWYVNVRLTGPANQDLAILTGNLFTDALPAVFQREGNTVNVNGPEANTRPVAIDGAGVFDDLNVNASGTVGNQIDFGTPTRVGEGAYVNGTYIIGGGEIYPASGATAPFDTIVDLDGLWLNNAGNLLIRGQTADPTDTSSFRREDAYLATIQVDPAGGFTGATTVFFEDVTVIPGTNGGVVGSFPVTNTDIAFNTSGDVLSTVDIAGRPSTADGTLVRYDGATGDYAILAQEGSPSGIDGRDFSLLNGRQVALNDAGDVAFAATLAGDFASNNVIVKNGNKVVQEGDTVTTLNGDQVFDSYGNAPVLLTPAGDVIYYAQLKGVTDGTSQVLYFNDIPLLQSDVSTLDGVVLTLDPATGQQSFDGILVDALQNDAESFYLSADGRYLAVEVDLRNPVGSGTFDSAVIIDLATIPEPASGLALAAAGLLTLRRRR
jgi:hypothetical protein